MRKNNIFLITLIFSGLVFVSTLLVFEDDIKKYIERYAFNLSKDFYFDENSGFFNQFDFSNMDEIYENLPGRIPILEYHIIESPYVYSNYILTGKLKKNIINERFFVTSSQLREQLDILYKNGFRNISLNEYLSLMKGEKKDLARIPPNSKLYVLTFDDATYGQFDFITNNKNDLIIDPECAVGILIDFARKHPDFKLNAAFCIDFENVPFLQPEYVEKKLNLLLDYGFEIVNHTKDHKSLTKLFKKNPALVEYQIGKAMEIFESYLGYRAASINKICYPFGDESRELANFIKKINFNGREYRFIAAIDAEGPLAFNPNETNFDPYRIRRVEINPKSFSNLVLYAKGIYKTPPLVKKNSQIGRFVRRSKPATNVILDVIKIP